MAEVHKLVKLLLLYLTLSGFYRGRKDTDWSMDESYMDKVQSRPLEVQFVDNLPEYSVYVALYAEYLSNGLDIPVVGFEANLHCSRYGALLWNYGSWKNEAGKISNNEASTKPNRPLNETISQLDIVME
ncbi:hypothetical protein HAX54_000990 [Datura stramonium]|uniref:Uncharacterized protein n=1 Tax=Datura stramonium TaxID=4076 RepID=A0ABS8T1T1_DATST|nr:hypothetical protein [Datura stramonium]